MSTQHSSRSRVVAGAAAAAIVAGAAQHSSRSRVVAGAAAAAIIAGAAVVGTVVHNGATAQVTCTNSTSHDGPAIQAAVNSAATVTIAAGTCAMNGSVHVARAVTINGAGPGATYLIQHARSNILQITAPGVTVENLTLDTRTCCTTAPILKNPDPGTLFSNASNTHLINLKAVSGTGFDIRVVGPSPCQSDQTTGTVMQNLTVENTGRGGFTTLDVDCTNGATVTNISVLGDYIALFLDRNVTVANVTYQSNVQQGCGNPIFDTTGGGVGGVGTGIHLSNITGGHAILVKPSSPAPTISGFHPSC